MMDYPSPFTEIFTILFLIYVRRIYTLRSNKETHPTTKKGKQMYTTFGYVMSTIHAVISGSMAIHILLDRGWGRCIASGDDDWTIGHIMAAYLTVDLICVAMWFSGWSIVVHHLFSIIGLWLAIRYNVAHGIVVRFALTELSTIPLNTCQLIKINQRGTWALVPVGIVLVIVYFAVRVCTIPEMVYTCYPEMYNHLPTYVIPFGYIATTWTAGMNVWWFSKILRSLITTARGKTDVEKGKQE